MNSDKALLLVDVQNDFLPGGALAVPKGDEIVPILNQLIPLFSLVVATLDWHPQDHTSFAANHPGKKPGDRDREQVLWPVHCVQFSWGAELSSALHQEKITARFFKGSGKDVDSYSGFFDNARFRTTGLADYLHQRGVKELFVGGLATDYCVLYTVLDALDLGFQVNLILDGCKAINLQPDDEQKALDSMRRKGARLLTSQEILVNGKSWKTP